MDGKRVYVFVYCVIGAKVAWHGGIVLGNSKQINPRIRREYIILYPCSRPTL